MKLAELAYIVIGSRKLAEWGRFAETVMGAMPSEQKSGSLHVRLDEWPFRFLITPHHEEKLICAGWAVADFKAYQDALGHMRSRVPTVHEGSPEECHERLVSGLFRFSDPGGNTHEVCWGRTMTAEPFQSRAAVSAFVTGDLGMGHVVLPCHGDYDETLAFYQDVMGLNYSDFSIRQTGAGTSLRRAYFFHCDNARQHSLALIEVKEPLGLHHFLTEVASLDDVGRALDRVQAQGVKVKRTLGRHVNDSMVSFYVETPSGFQMEYGFGGRRVDWTGHQVRQINDGSYWGHVWTKD